MMKRTYFALLLGLVGTALQPSFQAAQAATVPWTTVGPEGGDARGFAYDPKSSSHIYMGTTGSWVYESTDGGQKWQRLAHLGKVDDLIVDNILVDSADPKTIFAGVWQLDRISGGIFISHDSGKTWATIADMDGQSVRALSQAPSNSNVLVAGTIAGIYQSSDAGLHWKEISPPGSGEIHKVESIAIDPGDPKTIYAGTWHLPWKTTDGGANWHNIKQGLIDDSDVFSIIIDPQTPSLIYASACSGIYQSETGGELFRKVQGIPSTARRTRVLQQDPSNHKIVYAGTTEGLYKTLDGGTNWSRMTGPDVIINDVYVDPKNTQHVLLATDRSGVLASQDAGATFKSSNSGISQRQVTAFLADSKNNETLYAGVVNDKSYGGVFVSQNRGTSWTQQSSGLEGRDVFNLSQASDGSVYAGTSHGIFHWNGSTWEQDNKVINTTEKVMYVKVRGRRVKKTATESSKPTTIDSGVSDLSVEGAVWFAATADGVYRSTTNGATWSGPVLTEPDYRFVDANGSIVFAGRRSDLRLSEDSGVTWKQIPLPAKLTLVRALATDPSGTLWLGGLQGAFYSSDRGATWQQVENLPMGNINNIGFDQGLQKVVLTSSDSTLVFAMNADNKSWKWWDAGWKVRMVHSIGGRLVGASLYDGIVVEPVTIGSPGSAQGN